MFRSLKNGNFASHTTNNSSSKLNPEDIKKLVMKMAVDFANQMYESGTVSIEQQLTEEELVALVEICIHELIYYHQIGEIGCFLATAFAEDEKDAMDPDPDTPQSVSSEEDCGGGLLCRTASAAPDHPTQAPAIGQIATNLLVASGEIRKKITNLFMELAMPNELFMLGPAGYSNSNDTKQQEYYYGRIVQTMMIRLGGKVEIKCGMTLDQLLEKIVDIAKSSWALMDLCSNSNAFRFAQSENPLFKTIQINPTESVFGNLKQNLQSQVPSSMPAQQWESDDVPSSMPAQQWESDDVPSSMPVQQWESDDVLSSAPLNTYAGHVLDYDSSGWDEFDEDQRRGGGYDHAEEAS